MIDKFPTELYKIHPLPVPQQNISAFIKPQADFISLSHDKRTYSFMTSEDLLTCKSTGYHRICYHHQPIYETDDDIACEYQLLNQPSNTNFGKCNVQLISTHKDHWIHLSSTDTWLFSINRNTTARILCPGERDASIQLSSIGIIHLKPLCSSRINHVTLMGMTNLGSIQESLYLPSVSLNISKVDSLLYEKFNLISTQTDGKTVKTNRLDEGESLISIQRKYDDFIADHAHVAIHNYSSIGTGVLFIITLILLFIACLKYTKFSLRRSSSFRSRVDSSEFTMIRPINQINHPSSPSTQDVPTSDVNSLTINCFRKCSFSPSYYSQMH